MILEISHSGVEGDIDFGWHLLSCRCRSHIAGNGYTQRNLISLASIVLENAEPHFISNGLRKEWEEYDFHSHQRRRLK